MTKEQQIKLYEARRNVLEARGTHNNAIVKKLDRKNKNFTKIIHYRPLEISWPILISIL